MRTLSFRALTMSAYGLGAAMLPAEQVVISEIMYNPKEGLPEYIEIQNLTSTPFDIAEWSLSNGVGFTFPEFVNVQREDSFLEAFETFVICSTDPSTFRDAYGLPPTARVFGPWEGSLSNSGERITLTDKNGTDVCSVNYNDRGDWPVSPDGTGHSLVLVNPNRDIEDPAVWAASSTSNPIPGAVLPNSPEEAVSDPTVDLSQGIFLVDFDSKWDYNDANVPVGPDWQLASYQFGASGWTMEDDVANRGGLYGFDNDPTPAGTTIRTSFPRPNGGDNHITYFFRKNFEFPGTVTSGVNISIDSLVDDGAHFYLNGTPIGGTPNLSTPNPPPQCDRIGNRECRYHS